MTGTPMPELTETAPTRLRRWIAAARPRTLPLTLAPVLAGLTLAVADTGRLAFFTGLATLLAAAGIQVGTNLHNDAADFERGTDTPARVGPARAAASGWFTAAEVRRAAHLAFLFSLLLGLALVVRGGLPILILGLVSIAAGYAYTSGPRPIAYGPHGELYVLVFFGIAAVAGTYYLQTLSLSAGAITLGIAVGLPAAAVLLLNNYRDHDTDRVAGRHTLCHVLGRRRARALYAALLIAPVPLLLFGDVLAFPWPVLLALPLAWRRIRRLYAGASGPALNPLLGDTALYELVLVGLVLLSVLLHLLWQLLLRLVA